MTAAGLLARRTAARRPRGRTRRPARRGVPCSHTPGRRCTAAAASAARRGAPNRTAIRSGWAASCGCSIFRQLRRRLADASRYIAQCTGISRPCVVCMPTSSGPPFQRYVTSPAGSAMNARSAGAQHVFPEHRVRVQPELRAPEQAEAQVEHFQRQAVAGRLLVLPDESPPLQNRSSRCTVGAGCRTDRARSVTLRPRWAPASASHRSSAFSSDVRTSAGLVHSYSTIRNAIPSTITLLG